MVPQNTLLTARKRKDETMRLTEDDKKHLRETYRDSIQECEAEGWEYEGEVVMTSQGYVDLGPSGEVIVWSCTGFAYVVFDASN